MHKKRTRFREPCPGYSGSSLAVLGKLGVAAEPGVSSSSPNAFVGGDVVARGAGFFKLLEVTLVATRVNDCIFVAAASTFVQWSAVDLWVIADIHVTSIFGEQKDVVFKREHATRFFSPRSPLECISAAFCVHSDQAIFNREGITFERITSLFATRNPHERTVNKDVRNATTATPVVLDTVISCMFDVGITEHPARIILLDRDAVTRVEDRNAFDGRSRSIEEGDSSM